MTETGMLSQDMKKKIRTGIGNEGVNEYLVILALMFASCLNFSFLNCEKKVCYGVVKCT